MKNYSKKYNKKILVYEIKYDFIVEVIKDYKDNISEFWLYNKDYGIKMFMYGIECDEKEYEQFIFSDIDCYIKGYKRLYMEY